MSRPLITRSLVDLAMSGESIPADPALERPKQAYTLRSRRAGLLSVIVPKHAQNPRRCCRSRQRRSGLSDEAKMRFLGRPFIAACSKAREKVG